MEQNPSWDTNNSLFGGREFPRLLKNPKDYIKVNPH
jgi:hypothetical protein